MRKRQSFLQLTFSLLLAIHCQLTLAALTEKAADKLVDDDYSSAKHPPEMLLAVNGKLPTDRRPFNRMTSCIKSTRITDRS